MVKRTFVPPKELKNQQQELQRQQRIERWQKIWRSLIVSTIAGGLLWTMTLEKWAISDEAQIKIEGNRLVSKETILSLLGLSYPQSIWQMSTRQLDRKLLFNPAIAKAKVTRQLIPPSLTIALRERIPVAIASSPELSGTVGFLDAYGIWIPKSAYERKDKELPTLKVIGFREQYRPYWAELYQLIDDSPVKIFAVDWQQPSNLVLTTELGTVYLGSYAYLLPQKFAMLSQIRKLPNEINLSKIVYIDLTNPKLPPKIQMSGK